ncbi:MAG TPA: hypothetical protein VK968_07145, partial [Roseimicrobium sp.]|nr:hypothetical protein [Roseimicrobium sp.]
RRLFYPRSDWLCFSDLPEMLSVSSSDPERRKLFKVLSGNETMLMKLLVHPRSDVQSLVQYWSRGSRAKDIEPILESMSRLSTTNSIDVINFLPAFARKRLNTYPTPSTQKDRPNEDCFWTAFNFFNDPPGETVKDQNQWGAELNARYQMVASPAFGDMVFVTTPQGDAVHAAVYIADNVVFTKNGGNLSQPWLLMTMQDMLAEYLQYFPLKISYFRLKQPAF